VDTNVLVALADDEDDLHARAVRDLKRLGRGPFGSTVPVLSESFYLLPEGHLRLRLRSYLEHLRVAILETQADAWEAIFDWMEQYEEHEPALADAQLVALSAVDASRRVWSYDRDFLSLWRRPDGTRVPIVVR
jgi:predicted nucleic acid-binding protein